MYLVPTQRSPVSNTLNTLIGKMCLYYLQLKDRDAHGNTPFMTAIQCHNVKAAIYILDFVERNKGIVQSHMRSCPGYITVSLSLSLIMLCHANICTIEIKLHDRRIVGGNLIPILRIFSSIKYLYKLK